MKKVILCLTIALGSLSYSQIITKNLNLIGSSFQEILKLKGNPVDIKVDNTNDSIGPVVALIYNYNETYFFANNKLEGFGYGFSNKEGEKNARLNFERKYGKLDD